MRYKGWNKSIGWVFGYYSYVNFIGKIYNEKYPDGVEVNPKSIRMFSTYIDKKGQKIFTGDILLCKKERYDKKNYGIVSFTEGSFVLNWIDPETKEPTNEYSSLRMLNMSNYTKIGTKKCGY